MTAGPFTPTIRGYTRATSLEDTDAFEIDRQGVGTMYIEAADLGIPSGVLIYATLPSGTTDDWAPTGYIASVDAIVITTDAGGSTLAGLTGGTSDRRMVLANAGPGDLTLAHASSGTAANDLYLPGSASLTVETNGAVAMVYDDQAGWRAEAFEGNPAAETSSITYVIDGGGAEITTGEKGNLEIPFACTITRCTLLGNQSGSVECDIWMDTYANFPPTIADSIVASAPPTISSSTKSQDSTLTGWTVAVPAGSTMRFVVNSVTAIQILTIALTVTKG